MRVVLDTNIVMGGLINPDRSASGQVIQLCLEGKVEVLVSSDIRGEYLDVFAKMRFGRPEAVRRRSQGLQALLDKARAVEPAVRLDCIPEDPADNRFLECAVSGGACYIVSQDRHLLDLKEFGNVRILTAGDFLRHYRRVREGRM
jgi:putative PIN family toxin of toxin-antitoxin system